MNLINLKSKQLLNFGAFFKDIFPLLEEYKGLVLQAPFNPRKFLCPNKMQFVMDIFHRELGSCWEELRVMKSHGAVCHHIIYMLFGVYADRKFCSFSEEDQNILLWSVVFHDLVKRGTVFGPVRRDPFHPFLSAAATVSFFKKRNFFDGEDNMKAEELIKMLQMSRRVDLDHKYGNYVEFIDYKNVDQIFQMAKQILVSKFSLCCFIITAFHQSYKLARFECQCPIDETFLGEIYFPSIFELIKLVQINDSMSHIQEEENKPIIRAEFEESFE